MRATAGRGWLYTRRWSVVASTILVSLGVLSYSASANFTASSTVTTDVDSGAMALTVGAPGSADNRLTVAHVYGPGDTASRRIKLTIDNDGSTMSAVTLTAGGDNGPPSFVTDATDGLKVWIAKCTDPGGWAESGTTPNYTYTCTGAGDQYDVLGTSGSPVAVVQTAAALSNLTLTDAADNYLMVRMSLPSSAPSSMQGQTSNITFTFNGVQRAGAAR